MSITQSYLTEQPNTWQQSVKQLITCPTALLQFLELQPSQLAWQIDKHFPLRVSISFAAKMQKANPHDPLLRQVLSSQEESLPTHNYTKDPLQEKAVNPIPGVLHKFKSRVLLTLTQSCPIHCRYCFRRYFPYEANRISTKTWPAIKAYLQADPSIQEIVLSGGDPLMLPDERIGEFLAYLEDVQHIKIIRFHTRFPIIIPERITPDFVNMLNQSRFKKIMIYHVNHAQELCATIKAGVSLLQQAQIPILNQSVLLKDVNDKAQTLIDLSWQLFEHGILPYYIHLLDAVEGTGHFAVDKREAFVLEQSLRHHLPGYLVPKFVKEVPGEPAKVPL
ncbi:MAG: EF-P beta-lysylation protein EpmB [Candidatus Berkiella sp.]